MPADMPRMARRRRAYPTLSNNRGAVVLLAVYLSALVLLLLSGVSLQRTQTELHTAEVSRNLHQAFWEAEGALDTALVTSRGSAMAVSSGKVTVESLPHTPRYSIKPVYAEIYNDNLGTNGRVYIHRRDLRQRVVKMITASATLPGLTTPQNVSAYIIEEGPLRGVWANETIGIGAGRGQDLSTFVFGDVYSGRGSVISHVARTPAGQADDYVRTLDQAWTRTGTGGNADLLRMDGLILTPDGVPDSADHKTRVTEWGNTASTDLKSVKIAYELLQGAAGSNFDEVRFTKTADTTKSAHVQGQLAVGILGTGDLFDSRTCNSTIFLTQSQVVIDRNFTCDPDGNKTPGLDCDRRVEDRDNRPGGVLMCAKAIVPHPTYALGRDIINDPPTLIFRQPSTIITTGSYKDYSLNGSMMALPGLGMIPISEQLGALIGIRTRWDLELSARLSGVDTLGNPQPVEVYQAEANRPRRGEPTGHGVIYVGAGNTFHGSIYAPASLVVMRSRPCSQTGTCADNSFGVDFIVGNEVAIELDSDKLEIGVNVREEATDDTRMVGWVAQ